MNKEQLEAIVALMAGFQSSLVTLVKALEEQGAIKDMDQLISTFERMTNEVPEGVPNRETLVFAMRHVVTGLRDPGHDPSGDIAQRLH